jgi:hypothetical protein
MAAGLSFALILAAQAAIAAPPASGKAAAGTAAESRPAAAPAVPAETCPTPGSDTRAIIICTQRPQGYRLNPDIMEARRQAHSPGRPVRPGGRGIPDCAHVGPAPCMTAGIPLIGAALTAAEMARRLARGEEVGSMFVTDPQPSEYQLYQMAKARREANEAEKAAAAKAKAARAKADGATPQAQAAEPSRE